MKYAMMMLVAAMAVLTTGCAGYSFANKGVMQGSIYAQNQSNTYLNDDETGGFSKMGKSCAKSYLGMVTLGDATVKTAAQNGKISSVGVIDNTFMNIVGVYAEYCIVVYGD